MQFARTGLGGGAVCTWLSHFCTTDGAPAWAAAVAKRLEPASLEVAQDALRELHRLGEGVEHDPGEPAAVERHAHRGRHWQVDEGEAREGLGVELARVGERRQPALAGAVAQDARLYLGALAQRQGLPDPERGYRGTVLLRRVPDPEEPHRAVGIGCEPPAVRRLSLDAGDDGVARQEAVIRQKPAAAKGNYLLSMAVSSTMGPGYKIDLTQVKKFLEG